MGNALPKLGQCETCPLERYEVQPDGTVESTTLEDIHRLCAACPHSKIFVRRKKHVFVRYVDVCVDCPVKAAEDAIYAKFGQKYAKLEVIS